MTSKEALDRLKFIWGKETNTGSKSPKELDDFWGISKTLKVIEKLVERDTPKKVIYNTVTDMNTHNQWQVVHCPNCSNIIFNSAYLMPTIKPVGCDQCLQRLDWSE